MSKTKVDAPEELEHKTNIDVNTQPTSDEEIKKAEGKERSVKEGSSSNEAAEMANTNDATQSQRDKSESNTPVKRKRTASASENSPPQKRSAMIKTAWAEEVLKLEENASKEECRETSKKVGDNTQSAPATGSYSNSLTPSTSLCLKTALAATAATLSSIRTIDLFPPSPILSDATEDSQPSRSLGMIPVTKLASNTTVVIDTNSNSSSASSFRGFDNPTASDINSDSLDSAKSKSFGVKDNDPKTSAPDSDSITTLATNRGSPSESVLTTPISKTENSIACMALSSLGTTSISPTTDALPSELLATEDSDTVSSAITPSSSSNSNTPTTSNPKPSQGSMSDLEDAEKVSDEPDVINTDPKLAAATALQSSSSISSPIPTASARREESDSTTETTMLDSPPEKETSSRDPLTALVSDVLDTEDLTQSDTTTSPIKLNAATENVKNPPLTSNCQSKLLTTDSMNSSGNSSTSAQKLPVSNATSSATTSCLRPTPTPVSTKIPTSHQSAYEIIDSNQSRATLIRQGDANKGVIMSLQYIKRKSLSQSLSEIQRVKKYLRDSDPVPTLSPSYLKTLSTYIKTAKEFTPLSGGKSNEPLVAEEVVKSLIRKVEYMQEGCATLDEYEEETDEDSIILMRKISGLRAIVKQKTQEITSLKAAMKLLTPTEVVAEKLKKITK